MTYQVAPGDPLVSVDVGRAEKVVATKLKAAGIATEAQLQTVLNNLTVANNPGCSAALLAVVSALAELVFVAP